MGVNSLWDIIHPAARPIKLESLTNKKLAVDASIWIYQFLKAVRDKDGNPIRNAHIIGFFRRICKLLYFGIKPVFVFDGGAPEIKRKTINERRERKAGKKMDAAKTAERLLQLQLQRQAKDSIRDEKSKNKKKEDSVTQSQNDTKEKKQFRKFDEYHLPDLENGIIAASNDKRMISEEEFNILTENLKEELSGIGSLDDIDPSHPSFNQLPLSTQYMVLSHLRLRSRLRMGYSKEELDERFPDRMEFSKFQIERVRQRNFLTQKLFNIAGVDDGTGGLSTRRIASEREREYLLNKNEDGWTLSLGNDEGNSLNTAIDLDREDDDDEWEEEEEDVEWEDVEIPFSNSKPSEQSILKPFLDDNSQIRRDSLYTSKNENLNDPTSSHVRDLFSDDDEDSDLQQAIQKSLQTSNYNNIIKSSSKSQANDEHWKNGLKCSERDVVEQEEETRDCLSETPFSLLDEYGNNINMSDDDNKKLKELQSESATVNNDIKADSSRNSTNDLPSFNISGDSIFSNKRSRKVMNDHDHDEKLNEFADKGKRNAHNNSNDINNYNDNNMNGDDHNQSNSSRQKKRKVPELPAWFAEQNNFGSTISRGTSNKNDNLLTNNPYALTSLGMMSSREPNEYGDTGIRNVDNFIPEKEEEEEEERNSFPDDYASKTKASDKLSNLDGKVNDKSSDNAPPLNPTKEVSVGIHILPESEEDDLENQIEEEEQSHEIFAQQLNHNNNGMRKNTNLNPSSRSSSRSSSPLSDLDDHDDIDKEIQKLEEQRRKEKRDADDVTSIMVEECKELLMRFGIPYITARMEAEAQCAQLLNLGLVDGIITDDSDCFLFGGNMIYRNLFNQTRDVECYRGSDLERELGLSRHKLIALAHLLGSDYALGIKGIGPVTAMELLAEFKADGLVEFRNWWLSIQNSIVSPFQEDLGPHSKSTFCNKFKKKFIGKLFLDMEFPNDKIDEAYLKPEVDDDKTRFVWGKPDLDRLRAFLMRIVGWSKQHTDEILLPVIRDMNKREQLGTQSTLGDFFKINTPIKRDLSTSARMKNAMNRLTNATTTVASDNTNVKNVINTDNSDNQSKYSQVKNKRKTNYNSNDRGQKVQKTKNRKQN